MIRRLLISALLAFFACIPVFADSFNQTLAFSSSTGAPVSDGFSISPYAGTLNGQPTDFNCVDFSHDFGVPTTWNAVATPLSSSASFANTLQFALNGGNSAVAYHNYLEMAWLITQLHINLSDNDLGDATLDQLAVWTFSGYQNNNPANEAFINGLLAEANSVVQGGFTASGWEVLTPVYANFPNSQEMLIASESSTISFLLLGGLAALAVALFWRS